MNAHTEFRTPLPVSWPPSTRAMTALIARADRSAPTQRPERTARLHLSEPIFSPREPACFREGYDLPGNASLYLDGDELIEVHATVDTRFTSRSGDDEPSVYIHGAMIGKLAVTATALELIWDIDDVNSRFVRMWRDGDL